MPSKTITCDFFLVRYNLTASSLTEMVKSVIDLPAKQRRIDVEGDYCRLHDAEIMADDCRGVFLRMKPGENIEAAAEDTDELHSIELEDGFHPAHHFCFLYKHSMSLLVVHHDWQAGTYNTLRKYLEGLSGQYVSLSPMASCDAIETAKESSNILSANLTFALPSVRSQSETLAGPASHFIGKARDLGSVEFSVGFKGSRARRGGLDKDALFAVYDHLRSMFNPVKADMSVRDTEEDNARLLHLVQYRLHKKITFDCKGSHPTISEEYAALEDAFKQGKGEAKKWLRQNTSTAATGAD